MGEIRLFRVGSGSVTELRGTTVTIEKTLQTLIESHLEAFLGVRFLASEYATSKSHGGRIDTLGIDESNCPVIVEYKRAVNENVINQGLFYLNWLMDHRADFKLLVIERLGKDVADAIEWRSPRLICIASDFTKFDEHAIHQMPRDIDLVRYPRYGDDIILLELFASSSASPMQADKTKREQVSTPDDEPAPSSVSFVEQRYRQCSEEVRDGFLQMESHILAMGDGIQRHDLESYFAFRALKNFAYVQLRPTLNRILVDVALEPGSIDLDSAFMRKQKGKWVCLQIDSDEDLQRPLPLIEQSYRNV